ncbi:uncharacterized protein LOC132201084 isoform X2 [Neocloeon triangulifer]|uniref:uncharacterized protein LOC132201084 isoform X2 n=1 Tax=Neocloeon triangulifer TaxID=2078957 RepID=UPI00286FA171|nr:uncharacterized protein LOC132201084 isoform X2 [Neocloeon triangulifer]
MVSRRRILSRSRDDLNLDTVEVPEEDVWYQKDKLYKDHIQEVLDKWHQIDDEIWAKVIVLERNRRVAKAYARAPVLTINGSDDGFDGFRIGLCGFENPLRDAKTEEVKRHIGHGIKVKMDDQGNILIKRLSKSQVFVKVNPNEDNSVAQEITRLPNGSLEPEKPVKLFDMKKFQANVSRELRQAYPDRRRLECQCISSIGFVKHEADLLDSPVWVMIINVVALDMLKAKLPPVAGRSRLDIRNRPRIPIPDEDPYSVAGSGSSGSSSGAGKPNGGVNHLHQQLLQLKQHKQDKPPKLPPRDVAGYPHDIPKPDYDDLDDEEENCIQIFPASRGSKEKSKDNKKYDDPYYCGLRARIPNFVKRKGGKQEVPHNVPLGGPPMMAPSHHYMHSTYGVAPVQPWRPATGYLDPVEMNGLTVDKPAGLQSKAKLESPYDHIYGRLPGRVPIPTRSFIPPPPRTMYIGEWD